MDYLERLREILDDDQRVDLSDYIDIVRQALRTDPSNAAELVQETYEKALQEAYSSREDGALAKVALMGAGQLNSAGEHAGAIARLQQALQMAGDDASSRAVILGERAVYEALSERPEPAVRTQAEMRAVMPADLDAEAALSVATSSAMVSLVLFSPDAEEAATAVILDARANEFNWMASATMVFLVAALGSSEDTNRAVAWADSLHGYAASLPHEAREFDASVAQLALRARRRLVNMPSELDEAGHRTRHNIALWRLGIVKLYNDVMRGDSDSAVESAAALETIRPQINGGFSLASNGFGAFVQAHSRSGAVTELTPPTSMPTVLMVSGALASAETMAIRGSQSVAADWLRWFETRLPETVATSLEWPSCRKRVEGLLLLRIGREREATNRLQDGIHCCEERGDTIQAAIGRVQLSEALLRGSTASMVPSAHTRALGQAAAEELRSLGIEPIPFAYAASQTFLREEQMPERGGLTPREAQVLGRLAKGMTYREIGADLGINSRTVGVHASHCYEKLGVRNRVEAVKRAEDLGIV